MKEDANMDIYPMMRDIDGIIAESFNHDKFLPD